MPGASPTHPTCTRSNTCAPTPSLRDVGSRMSTLDDYFVERKHLHDRVCLRTVVGVANPRPTRGLDFGGRDGVYSDEFLHT
jgi:hypothetical protein